MHGKEHFLQCGKPPLPPLSPPPTHAFRARASRADFVSPRRMVLKIYRELMILGFISLMLVLSIEFSMPWVADHRICALIYPALALPHRAVLVCAPDGACMFGSGPL